MKELKKTEGQHSKLLFLLQVASEQQKHHNEINLIRSDGSIFNFEQDRYTDPTPSIPNMRLPAGSSVS